MNWPHMLNWLSSRSARRTRRAQMARPRWRFVVPRLEVLEDRSVPSLTPVLVVPGIVGSLPPPTLDDFVTFLTNRGVAPSSLRLDPILNTYTPLVANLT